MKAAIRAGYTATETEIARRGGRFAVVTHQAAGTAERLHAAFPDRLAAIFSPEHGYFGAAGAGEKTADCVHPAWGVPVHSLYGETRKPRMETLEGLSFAVFALQDIGVRCFTYLGTLAYFLEAAAEAGLPVIVEDRPVPLGGTVDGLRLDPGLESFVAPVDVPFCHGMTPGEAAAWIARKRNLDIDLTICLPPGVSAAETRPWPGFLPPSPAIRSWDCAVAYPATVFCEAFPAIGCGRSGPLAFRILSAPWLDARALAEKANPALSRTGFALAPYAPPPENGEAPREAALLVLKSASPLPAEAGFIMLDAILRTERGPAAEGARPEWLDKLCGRKGILDMLLAGELGRLLEECAAARAQWAGERIFFRK